MANVVEGLMSETCFIKQKKKKNFTTIDNTCIRDERLSWKEKGIHTYLMSLPEDWKIFVSEIVKHSRDGKSALYSAIQTLESYGYIKRIRNRDKNGRFEETVYYVYEEPTDNVTPLSENPDVVNPDMVEPDTENQTQLITNILTTNKQKTEPTNSNPQSDEIVSANTTVSESVFYTKIKELFSGEYPFDKNFENDVKSKLVEYKLSEDCIGDYLSYVFERTKLASPTKSFEGLYRKLALASSIVRDYKISSSSQNSSKQSEKNQCDIEYIKCPICGTKFDIVTFYCPKCNASWNDITKNNELGLHISKTIYEMSPEKREEYYKVRREREKASPRHFLTTQELEQLYKEFGIID